MKFPSKAGISKLRNAEANARKLPSRGFTLIEMVVVISLILVLIAIALPMYNQSIVRAKEAKLHQNLTTLNKVIQEYSLDKKHAPQSLDDLVPGYIKFIPDDITGTPTTWQTEPEDPENAWDPNNTGIGSVHSGSNELSSDGTAYSSWTH
ncbi:MAG: type II secretion system protein [Terriglobales bacterium]